MIRVLEKEPSKVPGLTSFFVYFEYKKELLSFMHNFDCRYYHSKEKCWEVPVIECNRLISGLTTYDDVELELLENAKVTPKKFMLSEYKTKPYDYQLDAIQFGLNHKKWLLLDEVGLGKSLEVIYLAEELYQRGEIEHCLIICGINALKYNWKKEIQKHSKYDCIILGEKEKARGGTTIGSIKERVEHLKSIIPQLFIITNIETMREKSIVDAINNGANKIGLIGLDEAHCIKSSQTMQSEGLLSLESDYKVAMTGTPILNDPVDSYTILNWIGVDKSIYTLFKNLYCVTSAKDENIIVGYKNLDYLKDTLSNCSLRRKKKEVLPDLPEQTIIQEFVELNPKHAKFYNEVKKGIRAQVDKVRLIPSSIRAMTTRLRQATALPSILTTSDIQPSKLIRAMELANEIASEGEKVVIFSTYKEPVYELAKMLNNLKPLIVTGDSKDSEIVDAMDTFQQDNEHKVFLGTWQKCGTGITLTKATHLIFIDTPFTQGAFEQCCGRISRIGTINHTFVHVLVSVLPEDHKVKQTIDEHVQEILDKKKGISSYVVDDEIPEEFLEDLKKYIYNLR